MRLKADLALLLTALVWGSGFVAQRVAANHNLGAFTFNGGRFLLGALLLLLLARRGAKPKPSNLLWMLLAGVLLFSSSALQQAGMSYTSAANAGFITGLYVVIVPLILTLAFKQHIGLLSWVAALLAVAGVWMLSAQGSFRLAPGDGLELAGSLLWALHVIVVGWAILKLDVLLFSAGQCLVAGLLSLAAAAAFELPVTPALSSIWWVILFSACVPIAMGFTLQAWGQKHAPAADAAVLLSMEAVFAALCGYIFLKESLTPGQIAGCALMLAAMLLAQIKRKPDFENKERQSTPVNLA
jgi:drug/metabolite transporter (DMT)-like permease